MTDWMSLLEPVRTWWHRAPPSSERLIADFAIERSTPRVSADYVPLYTYLEHRYASSVVLTFEQMEALLGFALPASAFIDPGWWTDAADTQRHSAAWIGTGRSATPNLSARIVTFERAPDLRHSKRSDADG